MAWKTTKQVLLYIQTYIGIYSSNTTLHVLSVDGFRGRMELPDGEQTTDLTARRVSTAQQATLPLAMTLEFDGGQCNNCG